LGMTAVFFQLFFELNSVAARPGRFDDFFGRGSAKRGNRPRELRSSRKTRIVILRLRSGFRLAARTPRLRLKLRSSRKTRIVILRLRSGFRLAARTPRLRLKLRSSRKTRIVILRLRSGFRLAARTPRLRLKLRSSRKT